MVKEGTDETFQGFTFPKKRMCLLVYQEPILYIRISKSLTQLHTHNKSNTGIRTALTHYIYIYIYIDIYIYIYIY